MSRKEKCVGYEEGYACNNAPVPGGTLCSYCKGRSFELHVCEALRSLGGNVIHNINVDGSQCDILAQFDEKLAKATYYVECKAEAGSTGVNTVNQFFSAFLAAKHSRHYDKAILVSERGFTADAKAKAESLGIICYSIHELKDRRADFDPYLRAVVSEYEETLFFTRKYYLPLDASLEGLGTTGRLDDCLQLFSDNQIHGPLMTIFADFGAGKTTTLRRFFWTQARKCLAGDRAARTPIFVNLRDFHLTMDLNKTLIGMLIDEYGLKVDGLRVFRQLNREGKLIILLDGFDEMVAKVGPEFLIPAFQQFEKVLTPQSKVVLTVRTHFLRDSSHLGDLSKGSVVEGYAKDKGYPVVYIQPLSPERIREYLNHVAPDGADKVLGNLRLGQLATRPILLDMVVETLPKLLLLTGAPTTSDLYRLYTEQWLGRDDWRCKMDHESRRFFSENLAYHFYKQKLTSLHYRDLPPIVQQHFPEVKKFRDLEYFDVDIRTSAFLSRDASGNYSFSHKSFYEYFVARKVVGDALGQGVIETKNRYPTEIMDFIEEIVGSELASWPKEKCQQVLRLLFEVFCSNDETILAYGSKSASDDYDTSGPDPVTGIRDKVEALITHISKLFGSCRNPNLCLVIFHYSPRKIYGAVEIASSMADWQRVPMRRLPGWMDQFQALLVVSPGEYEFKYLEDNVWEPRDNRVVSVSGDSAVTLQEDRHFGDVW